MAAAAAADPNLQLTNQLLGNPVLQYQLLMHSLLLPLLARTAPSGGTPPDGGAAADEREEEEVHLRMTVLANQLAITQLNQLVMGLIDDEANSKDNRGETTTHPEEEEEDEEEEERRRSQQQQALEYQKKLLRLLTEGFTAVHAEMTDAKDLLSSVLDAAVAGQNSTEALQLRVLAAASEGFANTSSDVTRLRDDLQDLTSSRADQLRDSTEALLWKVASAVSESFAEVIADVGSLRGEVHGLNATYARHSQEAMELTQVTATGLLRLQVDVNNLTATLEEALATFNNATSGVGGKEEKKGASCSDAAGEAWLCPDWFFLVGKECFRASDYQDKLSWAQARKSCRELGGDLAAPEEVLLLILAVRERLGEGLEGMWVGGGEQVLEDSFQSSRSDTDPTYDLFQPALWGWVSGEPVTHGWLHGQPLRPAGVNTCLTLSDLGLDSAYCESPRRFLCQRKALGDAGGHD